MAGSSHAIHLAHEWAAISDHPSMVSPRIWASWAAQWTPAADQVRCRFVPLCLDLRKYSRGNLATYGVARRAPNTRRYCLHVSSLSDVLRKYAERGDEGLLPAAEEIAQHGYLTEYLYSLAGNDDLASREPLVGYRHPNGFTKIKLVGLTDSGWTARLHVWNVGSSDRDIHSHRWPFASYVLSGSLVERRYEAISRVGQWTKYECGPSIDGLYALDNPQACDVSLIDEDIYRPGSSYQRSAEVLHSAMAGGETRPAVTLFIQGLERSKSSAVIRPKFTASETSDVGPQYESCDPADLLKLVMNLIAYA